MTAPALAPTPAAATYGPLYGVLVLVASCAVPGYHEFTDTPGDDAYVLAFAAATRAVRELGGQLVPLRDEAPDSAFAEDGRGHWRFDGDGWVVAVVRWR